ncbi:MAG TPA: 16S rRNA (guanine(527)-N(7))-methyltransferase RsmG [Candidatus Angelobacter sp.]
MDTTTIARLLEPFISLDETRLSAISKYIDLLVKWNARMNLTAVRDPEEMVQRHFGESFFGAKDALAQGRIQSVIDVGSGAGFPGVPFAMLEPGIQVTLIESNQKKVTFLRELVFSLDLKNAKVFSGRAEGYAESADLVMMRAVEKFEMALPVALKLVRPGGRIMLMIGSSQVEMAKHLGKQVAWNEIATVPGGHSRVLLRGIKIVKWDN